MVKRNPINPLGSGYGLNTSLYSWILSKPQLVGCLENCWAGLFSFDFNNCKPETKIPKMHKYVNVVYHKCLKL